MLFSHLKHRRYSFVLWLGFMCVLFSGFFLRASSVLSALSGGGNPGTNCVIISFYQTAGSDGSGHNFQNSRMHFWISPLCTGASITPPVGNSVPSVRITGVTDPLGNKYGYADTNIGDVYNGNYTLTASGPTSATATLNYNAYSRAACSLAWTRYYPPSAIPPNSLTWSALSCSGIQLRFNGVTNNTGQGTLRSGVNTVQAYGFNNVTTQYFLIDSISFFNVNPASAASITVTSSSCSASGLAWTISPGALTGSGTSGSYTVNPGLGRTYFIRPTVTSGTYTVSNSMGTGNFMFLRNGNSESFDITCAPSGNTPLNFSLSAPASVTVAQGGTVTVPVTSTLKSGTSEPISFSSAGYNIPADVTGVNYAPQPCPSPNCTENIRFNISPTAMTGSRRVTVFGVSSFSGVQRSALFSLDIIPASNFLVTCSASPSPAFVGQPVTWVATPTGNTGLVSYLWSGYDFPTGANAPTSQTFTLVYQTVGTKVASVFATDKGTSKTAACSNSLEVRVNPDSREF